MTTLLLKSPLAGWCLPLAEVPDAVFAERMAGDGIAIDPTGNTLHAPCDGEIVPMKDARHAMTIRAAGGHDILLHVGIDTVALAGEGFEMLVRAGEQVTAGQALLRFDLDLIARRARSTVTPVLLASEGAIVRRVENRGVMAGDFLMELALGKSSAAADDSTNGNHGAQLSRYFNIAFDHGLHARPAALVAAKLRPFDARVSFTKGDKSANARSTVALMSLGVQNGDVIEARASGADAAKALTALESLLGAPVAPNTNVKRASAAEVAQKVSAVAAADLTRIRAVIASSGVAIGTATQLSQPEIHVAENGEGVERETAALNAAIAKVKAHLESLANTTSGEQQTILAAHVELIQDPEVADRAHEWLKRGKSAGYAWRKALRSIIDTLHADGDERMMERVADLRDLENQVLLVLDGRKPGHARDLPERAILIADELLPSQLVSLDASRIAGICTARGGPTSHVAIIAAAMGVPALVAAGRLVLDIADGTHLVLNADHGHLHISPTDEERKAIEQDIAQRAAQHAADLAAAQERCHTVDNVDIKVYANLGALAETAPAVARGAEGCGLLRTEFLFLERRDPPDEDEQFSEYQAIATALGDRPLTIRTLDIGGDKPIPYLPLPREDNPALGLRGLRTSLWQPELLRTQLRAALRVKPVSQCRIMLPMVNELGDIRIVRALMEELGREMKLSELPSLGVMIETPASALLADQLIREVDFLSIGTNDLSQYTLAMDRGHPELAARLDALHPAVLRLIKLAADAANEHKKEIAVCGGLGSDPVAVPILIGLGVHEVSAVPAAIPRIKRVIRTLNASACTAMAKDALRQTDATAVRALVEDWLAQQHHQAADGTGLHKTA